MNCKRILPWSLIAVAGVCTVSGCASDECDGNRNTLPLAGFYSSAVSPQSISIDSLSIGGVGAPGDSLLLDSASNVSSVYLPFNLESGETEFEIRYLQRSMRGATDRIKFTYDAQPFFVSAACGVSYRFNIKNIECTHFAIDSVTVPGGVIDNANVQNIHIYFRVSTE